MRLLVTRLLAASLVIAVLALPALPSQAEAPAAIASQNTKARSSFESFAQQWMIKLRAAEKQQRALNAVSYRDYGTDYEIELRPTGHAVAPYVGILRYREHQYRCAEARGQGCAVSAVTPVTEIFRYQGGRWVY